MFVGVDHVGIGVGDLEAAVAFYGRIGFAEVLLEYEGPVPGTEVFTGADPRRVRMAMVASSTPTPVGPGRLKLVEVTDGAGPPPAPPGQAWGEVGVCEICLHARNVPAVHERLVAEAGAISLMEPLSGAVRPYDVSLDISYVADPWGGKIELIEWTGLWKSLPGEPRAEGVNHVAFGVADMEATRAFYAGLGFRELFFESTEFFEPMAPWYERQLPEQHMIMLLSPQGAGIEPCRLTPPGPDCRGEWGHLGPMEFAVGVTNLERACDELARRGVELLGQAQRLASGSGELRYVYLRDPDGLYVSLVEPRY